MTTAKRIKGDTAKFIHKQDENRVGGYLVRFTSPDDTDLHGEYFSKDTDFWIERGYPIKGERVLLEHGLDDFAKVMPIGILDIVKEDDIGIYVEARLHDRAEYEAMLRDMQDRGKIKASDADISAKADLAAKAVQAIANTGKIQWSSGALPQSVIVEDKHIKSWAIMEGSLTFTPAEPEGTEIRTIKSAIDQLQDLLNIQTAKTQGAKEPNGAKESSVPSADVDNDKSQAQGTNTMDEQINGDLTAKLDAIMAKLEKMFPEEMEDEEVKTELAKMEDDLEEEAKKLGEDATADALAEKAFGLFTTWHNKREADKKAIDDAMDARFKAWQANLPTDKDAYLPAAKHNSNGKAQDIQVGEPLKYAHLSATDMAMAWKMATAASPFGRLPTGLQGRKATDFVSEDFYRTAVHKMAAQVENTRFARAEDATYVKSIAPFKANELNASDITGQGLEYLGNVYDTMVWETARNNRIYQLMLGRGMLEKPVPQGMKNTIVPIEGNDPSVYGGVEGNSTDATGRPEVVYKITPQTTSTVTVTPGIFRTATAYTFELGEDSFVDMAAEANRKVNLALEEHIEKAMINGDTETAASTNINDIAGTPTSTGLTRDYFLEFDGLRKSPLVTSTAYSRDGGTLAVDDYRRTWALLGSNIAPRKNNIFFLIDFSTFNASLDLLPVLTRDVAGEDNSLFTGEFESLWGLPVYMSGFLALSNTAGKIDLDTPSNNTKGQIMAVYAPYWAFVFKRNITIEMQRSPDSETFEFYGSMRFALKRRSAAAAAISYNLTV